MKNVRANEALQERWTEDAKKRKKLQITESITAGFTLKTWGRVSSNWNKKIMMGKGERASIARVKCTLKYGKRAQNLKTLKNGLFWDGEQADSNWTISYRSWFFFFCYHLISLWSQQKLMEGMWPIHQIINIFQSQTDYMADNRESYSQVVFRNLMKEWKSNFPCKKESVALEKQ